jgi:hypothetical protein
MSTYAFTGIGWIAKPLALNPQTCGKWQMRGGSINTNVEMPYGGAAQ